MGIEPTPIDYESTALPVELQKPASLDVLPIGTQMTSSQWASPLYRNGTANVQPS